MPFLGNTDFSGGQNTRELGHLIKPSEGTAVEGIDINFSSVKTFPGDRRELIDSTTYPEIDDPCAIPIPGTAGGVADPILGRWRYYWNRGMNALNNSWVRVWGLNTIEYWNPTTQLWTPLAGPLWTLAADYKPWACQYQNGMYIFHGNAAVASIGKYFWSNGAGGWVSGDIPQAAAPLAALRPTVAVPYKNRIYACDQVNEPYRLRFSGVNTPQIWNPPNGGYVPVGEDRGDPIVSLIVHKDYLFVLKRASVWRFWVDYYGNQYIEQVHGAAGCVAPNLIGAYKDAIYYGSDEGAVAIYGADSDCVSHKIARDIIADPDHLWAAQMVVSSNGPDTRLWATYLREKEIVQDVDECGVPEGDPYELWHTDVWVADIRRPNIIKPRWVKLPYYRLTNFAMPPHSNNYRGLDNQNIHFDAQQPDMNEWNPDPDVTPDPLYIPGISGGPRHWSYRWNVGWDRDQVPAYDDPCEAPLYAGDNGIGYKMHYETPRYLPVGNLRRIQWIDAKLDYFIWRTGIQQGFDVTWSVIQIGRDTLELNSPIFPTEPTWWPIRDNSLSPTTGGGADQPYRFSNLDPSKGQSLKMEWNVVGTANRENTSHAIEFRFFGVEYRVAEDKFNPED